MEYIMLILSAVLLAVNFVLTKFYQKSSGAGIESSLKFNIALGIFTAVIFYAIAGFKFETGLFSAVLALAMSLCAVLYTVLGFLVMETGQVALYTFFLMTGGMVVPYIWGILFLDEKFSLLRTIGLIIIAASVFLINGDAKKLGIKTTVLCVGIFFLNGAVSVVSKMHQINPLAVSSESFVMLTGIAKVILCLLALKLIKKGNVQIAETNEKKKASVEKTVILVLMSAFVSGVSYLLQLNGAKNIDATVLYPIITGGSIFFTTITGWLIFKEKPTKKLVISIIMCFAGTCMFL